jgi:hypothetical protein
VGLLVKRFIPRNPPTSSHAGIAFVTFENGKFVRPLFAEVVPLVIRVVLAVPLLADIMWKDQVGSYHISLDIHGSIVAQGQWTVFEWAKERSPHAR